MLQLKWRYVSRDNNHQAKCGPYRLTVYMFAGEYQSEVESNGDVVVHHKGTMIPLVGMHRAERLLLRLVRAEQRRLAKVELTLKQHRGVRHA